MRDNDQILNKLNKIIDDDIFTRLSRDLVKNTLHSKLI